MTPRGTPPWALALGAMLSVQLGSALSSDLIDQVGPAGLAWLRLSFGAVAFVCIARPPLRQIHRADMPALAALGVASGAMSMLFLAAIERIPLGTAVAIEFLGPLTVAALRSPSRNTVAAPAIALVGVVLLTQPWHGSVDLAGVAFAALAAVGWGTYIVLTQRVGDRFSGVAGLSVTVPIAALTAATFGIPQAAGHVTWDALAGSAGLALLLPVLPFALEMAAMRRLTATAFGTLMSVEPAIGLTLGWLVLDQQPNALHIAGVALVVGASANAQRHGRRDGTGPVTPPQFDPALRGAASAGG